MPLDCRGFFIECIARNISMEEAARHLTITQEELTTKLFSEELFFLSDACKLHDLLKFYGSNITIDSMFSYKGEPVK